MSAGAGFSDDEGGGGDERHEPHMGRETEIRPMPPEPEIIYTAEEKGSGGGNTRLIIAIVLGIIIVGGIFLAMSGNEKGGVAPVSPDLLSEAPAPAEQMAPPAETESQPEEMSPTEQLQAIARGDMESTTDTPPAKETMPVEPAPTIAAPTSDAATPVTQAPVAEAPVAEAPVTEAPVPAPVETVKPAAPAKAVTPQAGGTYVVQLLALRDEGAARAAWMKIAAKHSGILAAHALDIEKVDLGSKGVWYRVRAAGFASKAAAVKACNRLKAAGQDCMPKKR